ncbi:hypothetical protein Tco_0787954 [Tanacetum coccineum]
MKPSSLDGTYARKDFHAYTGMEPQLFKETILKNFDFIEDYMLKTIIHAQTIQKRLDDKKLQIQECTVQEVKASDANSGDKDCSRIVSDKGNDQGLENQSNTSGDERVGQGMNAMTKALMGMIRTSDLPMTQNQWLRYGQNVVSNVMMCVLRLLILIANLNLDVYENKKIQIAINMNANTSLTHELIECKFLFLRRK